MDGATPEQIELRKVLHRRRLAEAMQRQSLQSSPTEMVSGRAVKQTALQPISQLAQALFGACMQQRADEQEQGVADRTRQQYDQFIGSMPPPGDREASRKWALSGASLPGARDRVVGAVVQSALSEQSPESLYGKIDPKDYTPESLAQFQQTGDHTVLRGVPSAGQSDFSRINPSDYTPESLAQYMQTRNPADLRAAPKSPLVTVENYPSPIPVVDPKTGETKLVRFGSKGDVMETPYKPAEDPGGMTAETAGKVAMLRQGSSDVDTVEQLLFPNGKFDRMLAAAASVPFTAGMPGNTNARKIYSAVHNAVQAKLRAETGAAAPDAEVANIVKRFMPGPLDTDESARDKVTRLRAFMQMNLEEIKGTQERKDRGKPDQFEGFSIERIE